MARAEPRVSQEGNANRLGKDGYANGFFSTKSDRTIRKPCNAIGVQNLVAGVNERYGELRQQRSGQRGPIVSGLLSHPGVVVHESPQFTIRGSCSAAFAFEVYGESGYVLTRVSRVRRATS